MRVKVAIYCRLKDAMKPIALVPVAIFALVSAAQAQVASALGGADGVFAEYGNDANNTGGFVFQAGRTSSNGLVYTPFSSSVHDGAHSASKLGGSASIGSADGSFSTNVGAHSSLNFATATSDVHDISISFSGFSFTADRALGMSVVTGDVGSFAGSYTLDLENPVLVINGETIDVPTHFASDPSAPHFIYLYNQNNLQVLFNESQMERAVPGGVEYVAAGSFEIYMNGFKGPDGTLSYGDFQLANAGSVLSTVPEPCTLLGLGAMASGMLLRRRRAARR